MHRDFCLWNRKTDAAVLIYHTHVSACLHLSIKSNSTMVFLSLSQSLPPYLSDTPLLQIIVFFGPSSNNAKVKTPPMTCPLWGKSPSKRVSPSIAIPTVWVLVVNSIWPIKWHCHGIFAEATKQRQILMMEWVTAYGPISISVIVMFVSWVVKVGALTPM